MKIKCIIIEDEPLATKKLETFIQRIPFLELVASFENAIQSLTFLKSKTIDLILLDIQMEQLTGIQFLETLTERPYIIITSAYAEYALKGYELRVFDYLLKPFSFERFLAAVNKVYDDMQTKQNGKQTPSYIFVKTEYRIENIMIDDILYIEGMQGYLQIHMLNRKIMTKQSFKSILALLPGNQFAQVHKSWVVSITKIESIERNRIKIGKALIPIGDTYREAFFAMIKQKFSN
jgi:two-component system, LytTR family, response regulator